MFLETILSITTIIIFSLFAIRPTLTTIISLVNEVKTKEKMVSFLDEKIDNLDKAREVYGREQANIQIIETAIPDYPSPDILAKQIEALANQNSVRLIGFSVGETQIKGKAVAEKKTDNLKKMPEGSGGMPITINLAGEFPNLFLSLKDLEKLLIPIKFDAFRISSLNLEAGKSVVMAITGRAPFYQSYEKQN